MRQTRGLQKYFRRYFLIGSNVTSGASCVDAVNDGTRAIHGCFGIKLSYAHVVANAFDNGITNSNALRATPACVQRLSDAELFGDSRYWLH